MIFEYITDTGEKNQYSSNKNQVVIGRGTDADCQIIADGISRKHAVIREAQGRFYITDLNSSNGTFINDEQARPGVETEFFPVFPIRLGGGVTIYIKDESELEEKPSLKMHSTSGGTKPDLKAARNDKAANTRTKVAFPKEREAAGKKDKAKEKEKKKLPLPVLALIIIAGACYYFYQDTQTEESTEIAATTAPTPKVEVKKIPKAISKEIQDVLARASGAGCESSVEKVICEELQIQSPDFVSVRGDTVLVVVNFESYMRQNSTSYSGFPVEKRNKIGASHLLLKVAANKKLQGQSPAIDLVELIALNPSDPEKKVTLVGSYGMSNNEFFPIEKQEEAMSQILINGDIQAFDKNFKGLYLVREF